MRADMTFSPGVFIKMKSCNVQVGDVQGYLRDFAEHMWNIPAVHSWRPGVNPTTLPPTCSIYSRAPPVARQLSSGSALSAIPPIAPAPSTTTCELSAASAPTTTTCELSAAVDALRETITALRAELTALKGQVVSLDRTVDRLLEVQGEQVEVQLQPQPQPQLQEPQALSQEQEPPEEAEQRRQPRRGDKRHFVSG